MRTSKRRRVILLGLLLAVWLSTSACSCGNALQSLVGRNAAREVASPTLVARQLPTATEQSNVAAATEVLPTEQLTVVAATPATVGQSIAAPSGQSAIPTIPAESNQAFQVEMTEDQIAQELAGQVFEQQGFKASDIHVMLTDQEIICSLRVQQADTGLSTGITVRGVPVVASGAVYFKVNQVTLDDTLSGFARLIAQSAVEQAIKQYSTPQGIPIPTDNIEVQSVQLLPGKIIVTGRTR